MGLRISAAALTLLAIALVTGVPSIYAETVSIRLDDGAGHAVTVVDGGVGDANPNAGVVTFVGSIGAWNIDVSTGQGSSVLGPGRLDLNSVNTSSLGTGTTLSILFTQTDMTTTFPGWQLHFGGTATNLSSVAYDAYADDNNGAFALTSLIGAVGPFTSSPFNGTASGSVDLSGSYSLTQRIQITGIANRRNSFNGDADLTPLPEPTPFVLLGIALVGISLFRRVSN